MMADMTTQQKDNALALVGGGIGAVFKGTWWVVKKIWGAFIWCLGLIPAKKDNKPMSLPSKIMMGVFVWGLGWFVAGFDGSGFLRFLGHAWDALLDGRLVF